MVKKIHHHNNSHQPVLLQAVLDVLQPRLDETYLDLTAGYGGHAAAILEKVGDPSRLTLVDRDQNAQQALTDFAQAGSRVIDDDFLSAARLLTADAEQFDMILLDVGVSSPHLDIASRGFSFLKEARLDMRMDQRQDLDAHRLVNDYSLQELTDTIRRYGQEPRAARIAQAIVAARPIETTTQLAQVIANLPARRRGSGRKIHPATQTFQALRIAVNDELAQLEMVLPLLPDLLNSNGRLAVISFHSLEDGIVKAFLAAQKEAGYEAQLRVITKKPIQGASQDVTNPRARSAKLRAAAKINT